MKISIIMPIYNCEKYLNNSIDSIINQTYSNWELILIDDGSVDDSLKICNEYAKKNNKIKVLSQENKGSGAARNKGIDESTGDYLMFCDADDFFQKNALEIFLQKVLETKSDLIISGYNEFKYNNYEVEVCGNNSPKALNLKGKEECRKNHISLRKKALIEAPWAKIYNAKIVKDNKVYFGDFRRCQDTIFNITYYNYINSISVIEDKLYNYQTPDGDVYISKYPKDMLEIRKEIDKIVTDYLIKWDVYNEEAHNYLNSVLALDLLICCRLNFNNNWSFDKGEQKKYIIDLLNDSKYQEVISNRKYGTIKNILCLVLKSKSYLLIKITNKMILLILKLKYKYI